MKKKIVFVLPNLSGGGAERFTVSISNYLAGKEFKVSIFLTSDEQCDYLLSPDVNVELIGFKAKNPIQWIRRCIKISTTLNSVIDSSIVYFDVFNNPLYLFPILFINKNRIILSKRCNPNIDKLKVLRNIIYKRAKACHFQTNYAKEEIPWTIQNKSIVISNSLRPDLPQPYDGERKDIIVAVGRLCKEKNYKLLIDSFNIFNKLHENYQLHIYGQGEQLYSLQEYVKKLGLIDKVRFKGFQSDIHDCINNAKMYVLSSNTEGMSNSLMEALALGIPCISTDCPIGGSATLIQDHDNGLLVPVGNVEKLSEAMCELANNEDLAQKLSENAKKIRDKYSEEVIMKEWMQFFQ